MPTFFVEHNPPFECQEDDEIVLKMLTQTELSCQAGRVLSRGPTPKPKIPVKLDLSEQESLIKPTNLGKVVEATSLAHASVTPSASR
mmetsp:Transcript_45743/g.115313  ORF Transcript_45743/g.115313 Transcript_45743/m.115313 type:complete len:87 (-) Transcript_45743:130-390(-)